ncbi:MAG: cobalamin-dependent protein, partial [Candidatus Adiutrix sp.]|nr:cobalamin-dependent protein [Candidatus Adiutrix sp.]
MRVLMVAANPVKIPYPVYPLGAGILADAARRAGHEVRLLDILAANNFSDEYDPGLISQAICDFQPDCVALSLRNLEGAEGGVGSLELAQRIAADIRAATPAPLVVGGAGFSVMPEAALPYLGADYGLAGEGEEIWPAFLEALAEGRTAPGLLPRAVPGARQASAYDEDLVRAYAAQGGLIGVQTKRGCPLRCLYCSYPLLEGRRVRPRPVDEVLD